VPGFTGYATPISDIAMIFLNDIDPMLDKNVRLAPNYAIDKQAIVDRLLRGYGVPIDTLEAPEYAAFDPSIKSRTTRSSREAARRFRLLARQPGEIHHPDHPRLQAEGLRDDPGDRRHVAGRRHRGGDRGLRDRQALRAARRRQLAPAAFYNWGNSIGDPSTSTGFAMFGPSPHSVWDGQDVFDMILPLWGEADEEKRIAGYKAVAKHIAEEGAVIPLLQYVQPIIGRPVPLAGAAGKRYAAAQTVTPS
jgi:peptide/nickel transport system substrate-binding protein